MAAADQRERQVKIITKAQRKPNLVVCVLCKKQFQTMCDYLEAFLFFICRACVPKVRPELKDDPIHRLDRLPDRKKPGYGVVGPGVIYFNELMEAVKDVRPEQGDPHEDHRPGR